MILHISNRLDWEQAQQSGQYWTPVNQAEGFIHCSKPEQILAVAERYFAGRQDLLLLWIDPLALQAELRWEPVGEELYPHLYGPLNLDSVQAALPFLPDEDGLFRNFPDPT